jgi:hypothetical protein
MVWQDSSPTEHFPLTEIRLTLAPTSAWGDEEYDAALERLIQTRAAALVGAFLRGLLAGDPRFRELAVQVRLGDEEVV